MESPSSFSGHEQLCVPIRTPLTCSNKFSSSNLLLRPKPPSFSRVCNVHENKAQQQQKVSFTKPESRPSATAATPRVRESSLSEQQHKTTNKSDACVLFHPLGNSHSSGCCCPKYYTSHQHQQNSQRTNEASNTQIHWCILYQLVFHHHSLNLLTSKDLLASLPHLISSVGSVGGLARGRQRRSKYTVFQPCLDLQKKSHKPQEGCDPRK